jgi:hypothetical protein
VSVPSAQKAPSTGSSRARAGLHELNDAQKTLRRVAAGCKPGAVLFARASMREWVAKANVRRAVDRNTHNRTQPDSNGHALAVVYRSSVDAPLQFDSTQFIAKHTIPTVGMGMRQHQSRVIIIALSRAPLVARGFVGDADLSIFVPLLIGAARQVRVDVIVGSHDSENYRYLGPHMGAMVR